MTNKELIYVIQQIGNEKGIGTEVSSRRWSPPSSRPPKTMGVADNVRMHLDQTGGLMHLRA
jgi:hypothetical protein